MKIILLDHQNNYVARLCAMTLQKALTFQQPV